MTRKNLLHPPRWTLRPGTTRFDVVLLSFSLLWSSGNAQSRAGAPPSQLTRNELYHFDPSVGIVFIVLVCAFFFVGLLAVYIRQCSNAIDSNSARPGAVPSGDRSRLRGLDPAVIGMFPVFIYSAVKEIKIGRETLECAICLSKFEDDETLRLLPKCNHVFHPECIDRWLAFRVTCPVCRSKQSPESLQISTSTPQQTITQTASNQDNSAPEVHEIRDEIVVTVNEPTSRIISGKFPRSHSTGHSLVQLGENIERYTLRLPEDMRRQIMASARLKRARSFNAVVTAEGSWGKGYRIGDEGSSTGRRNGRSDGWVFSRTPPFISKGGSVKCSKLDGDGDSFHGRSLFASVKAPLNCLNVKDEEVQAPSARTRPPV